MDATGHVLLLIYNFLLLLKYKYFVGDKEIENCCEEIITIILTMIFGMMCFKLIYGSLVALIGFIQKKSTDKVGDEEERNEQMKLEEKTEDKKKEVLEVESIDEDFIDSINESGEQKKGKKEERNKKDQSSSKDKGKSKEKKKEKEAQREKEGKKTH